MKQSDDPTFRGTISADDLQKTKEALKLRPYQERVFNDIHASTGLVFDTHRLRQLTGKRVIGVDLAQKGGDKTSVIQAIQGRKGEIFIIDEYSTFPNWKWYRNPIKWWNWRQLTKKWKKNSRYFEFRSSPPSRNKFKDMVEGRWKN